MQVVLQNLHAFYPDRAKSPPHCTEQEDLFQDWELEQLEGGHLDNTHFEMD